MSLIFDKLAQIYSYSADRSHNQAAVMGSVKIYAAALLAISLTSCQGSNLGSSLEGAIAPSSTPIPEPVATTASPAPMLAPPLTAAKATPPTLMVIDNQMITLAKEAITKTAISRNTKLSSGLPVESTQAILKSLLYIDLAKFPSFQSPASSPVLPSSQAIAKFQDLDQVPAALRSWINDLAQLGTISAKTGQNFQPNIPVARREYARWLVETNNRLYQDQPSRQIRLAQPSDRPSFGDIPTSHPDFAIIQGLANAGLIASGDRFRPNDQLSREDMIQWKIPLDLRQPLPSANLNSINQSWGFQDSDRISEVAQRAIFADAQLRDLSNIRRSFGFTTLLQPQKPVTRAEAAASLWYFGTATDGISVAKALQSKQQ